MPPPPAQTALRRVATRLVRLGLAAALAALAAALPAWDSDRMQRAATRLGPRASAAVRQLQPLLQEWAALDERARLAQVNEFYNRRVVFRDDQAVWGQVDYWASPLETLARGEGDCEDFAIAKYFSLLAAGTPVERLRLVYVQAQVGGTLGPWQPHMVLAWYAAPGAEPLVLDSLITEVRPASRRPDLQPVFSFNGEGLWKGPADQPAPDALARLGRWHEVQAKARAEGFL